LSGVMRQDASVLIVLFKSQNMAETVARRLRLEDYFPDNSGKHDKARGLAKTSSFLRSVISTYVNKDGAVEINLEAKDPRLAEEIVNSYIVSTSKYLNDNSIPLKFVIVDPAKASSRPSSPNLKMNMLAALIVSLILGISFSLLDDYFQVILRP
jgi:capsular polysaccharide biosynthesis protein